MPKDKPENNVWIHRTLEFEEDKSLEGEIDLREISPEDIDYLRKYRYPFLEIVNNGESVEDARDYPLFIKAPNGGWTMQDRVDVISASPSMGIEVELETKPGEKGEGGEDGESGESGESGEDDEGDEGEGAPTIFDRGAGTIINQAVMTAFDMVMLAVGKGWQSMTITDGTELMKWAAWAAAQDCDLTVSGFEPSEKDKKKYERLRGLQKEAGKKIKLGPGMSG